MIGSSLAICDIGRVVEGPPNSGTGAGMSWSSCRLESFLLLVEDALESLRGAIGVVGLDFLPCRGFHFRRAKAMSRKLKIEAEETPIPRPIASSLLFDSLEEEPVAAGGWTEIRVAVIVEATV